MVVLSRVTLKLYVGCPVEFGSISVILLTEVNNSGFSTAFPGCSQHR